MHTMKITHTFLLLCLVLAQTGTWAEEISLKVGSQTVRAEIADTEQSRERGLMQRDHLCADCGMLFVFEQTGRFSFWMKNTPLPLGIAFIAADGSIINIEEMLPNTTNLHNSQSDALYALEMNSGWFARNGISLTDKVEGLKHSQYIRSP
jgi:uncharacterized membrane protein (UPF0127 family)